MKKIFMNTSKKKTVFTSINKQTIYCVGPLPPISHGQSEAFDLLVNSEAMNRIFDLVIINLNSVNMTIFKKIFMLLRRYLFFRFYFMIKKPDALYISFGRSKASFLRDRLFLKKAIRKKIPIIAHYHGGDMPIFLDSLNKRFYEKVEQVFNKVERMIVLSERLKNDFQGLINMKKIRVIPNCFRVPHGYNISRSIGRNMNERHIQILFLSNVHPEKGFFETLEAIAILNSHGCNVFFTFIGSFINDDNNNITILKKRTDDLIKRHNLQTKVRIKGPLYDDKKWTEYLNADIFVLPTYYKSEGLPISIIEAMSSGCAIITTAYRGIPDLIDDGVEGLFVVQRDAKDLADKIEFLCTNPERLASMKKSALAKAMKNFTVEKCVNATINVIKEVVESQ